MTKFCDVQRTRSTRANLFYFISNFSPVREDTKKQEKMTLECRRCPRRGSVVAPYSCLLCISPISQGSTRFTHKDRKSKQVISKNDHYQIYLFSFLEFFASLLKAGKVSHPDGEHTTVEPGPMFEGGPSSYTSSPSTFGFQPNGAGKKKASKQLANRRPRKKGLRLLPLTPLKQT